MQLGRDFIRSLTQITKDRGLSPEVVVSSLEAALISAYKKYRGGNQEVEVHIDTENGQISICEVKHIVAEVVSPDSELTLADAQAQGFIEVEEGDYIRIEQNPEDFGRIAAQTARQVIIQRLKDAERQIIFEEFSDRVGDLVTGLIFKSESDQVLVRLNDRTEAILPEVERIAGEAYIQGERLKFYLLDVRQTTRGPKIVVSRTHPGLLRKLMELEVPEIREGVIEIKNIVREAGARAKVAVQTLDINVDPVGACVGNSGARIKSISRELCGEKVDVIIWNNDPLQYIRNALSPAKIVKIEPVLEQEKEVTIYARPDQLSLAIGKAGQNVRLAARLTGWKINIEGLEPERMPTFHDLFQEIIEDQDMELKED